MSVLNIYQVLKSFFIDRKDDFMNDKIKGFLKTIPIPICGLILGTVSLGNLLFSEGFRGIGTLFCLIGSFIMLLFVMKLIFTLKETLADLRNPIIASIAPTFTMAWMVICVFLNRLFPGSLVVSVIWLVSIIVHLGLMIYFIAAHIFPVKVTLECIYPSWFITFVGIGVVPNTSEMFVKELGEAVIWLAIGTYLILLPVIIKRLMHPKKMEDAAIPLITILTAPGSLCLAGYLSVFKDASLPVVLSLMVLSQFIYFSIVIYLRKMLKVGFYPSYAAFTFPMVISATAIFKVSNFFEGSSTLSMITELLSIFETGVAILVVCYVLVTYVLHLRNQVKLLNLKSEYE